MPNVEKKFPNVENKFIRFKKKFPTVENNSPTTIINSCWPKLNSQTSRSSFIYSWNVWIYFWHSSIYSRRSGINFHNRKFTQYVREFIFGVRKFFYVRGFILEIWNFIPGVRESNLAIRISLRRSFYVCRIVKDDFGQSFHWSQGGPNMRLSLNRLMGMGVNCWKLCFNLKAFSQLFCLWTAHNHLNR